MEIRSRARGGRSPRAWSSAEERRRSDQEIHGGGRLPTKTQGAEQLGVLKPEAIIGGYDRERAEERFHMSPFLRRVTGTRRTRQKLADDMNRHLQHLVPVRFEKVVGRSGIGRYPLS